MTRDDIIGVIEKFAPSECAEDWDNCGMLIEGTEEVDSISIILDPTLEVLRQIKSDFIISHHPLIFEPLKKIDYGLKEKLKLIISRGQTFYSAHSSLDLAPEGVSWALSKKIGLMEDVDSTPLMRTGHLPVKGLEELVEILKDKLKLKSVKVVGMREDVDRVALIPGSGFNEGTVQECYEKGISTLISGDLKHHPALKAVDLGINLVDCGHRETEIPGLEHLEKHLKEELDKVRIDLIYPSEAWDLF